MILGIGTDICSIPRIEETLNKFEGRFITKTFTKHEQEYCESKSGKAAYYAKRFAAKEAVAKALAGDYTGSLSWLDVEVENAPSGRPKVNLYRGAKERLDSLLPIGHIGRIHLSLSDDEPFAVASVVIEAHPENKQA